MFRVHSVSQWPNLRHLGEPLGGAESLLEAVSFKKATEGMGRGRVVNARWEWVPHSGGCNTETMGGKCSANTRNGQQVSVCRAKRTCGGVVVEKGMNVSRSWWVTRESQGVRGKSGRTSSNKISRTRTLPGKSRRTDRRHSRMASTCGPMNPSGCGINWRLSWNKSKQPAWHNGSLYLSVTPKFYTKVLHQTANPTAELWCKTLSQIKVDLVLHRT